MIAIKAALRHLITVVVAPLCHELQANSVYTKKDVPFFHFDKERIITFTLDLLESCHLKNTEGHLFLLKLGQPQQTKL